MLKKVTDGPQAVDRDSEQTGPEAELPLDEAWVAPALEAVEAGLPYVVDSAITNANRSLGARLAGELALRSAQGKNEPVDVTFNLKGTAGQSFGGVSDLRG